MTELLHVEGDSFSRSHFCPGHFTASAFLLSPARDAVLLILHGKLKRWLQPGGHVAPEDATLMAAAARELMEETGVASVASDATLLDVDVHVIPALRGEPEHRHFDVRFLFQAQSLEVQAGSDAKDVRWVRLADVSGVESDASVMRAVSKLERRVLSQLPAR